MANLTASLPLTQGTNRVIDDPAGPSVFSGVLSTLSSGLEAYAGYQQERSKRKKLEAAEAEKKRKTDATYDAITSYDRAVDATTGGGYLTTDPRTAPLSQEEVDAENPALAMHPVFQDEKPASSNPALEREAARRGEFVQSIAAAVEQSRMPAVSLTTALNKEFRATLNRFPDQAEQVLDIWKKMGIDTTLFREGRDAADWADETREGQQRQIEDDRKFEQAMFERGMAGIDPELLAGGGTGGSPMSRDQVIAHGLSAAHLDNQLTMQTRRAALQAQTNTMSREAVQDAEKDTNRAIEQRLGVGIYNDSAPMISMVQNLMTSISKLPEAERLSKWQSFAPRIAQKMDNYVEQAVVQARAAGYTGDVDKLRSDMRATVERAKSMFSGELSVATNYMKALDMTTKTLRLNAAQAMPVFSALQAVGINANEMQGVMEGLAGNKGLQESLRNEMLGFSADFGKERASTRLMNIVKILRGEETLANMDPTTATQQLPMLVRTMRSLVLDYNRGVDVDPNMVVNSIGSLTIAARTLNGSSSLNALATATNGTAVQAVRTALIKAKNSGIESVNDDAEATILASRAASAQILNVTQVRIPKVNEQFRGSTYQLVWDKRTGKYEISRDTSSVAELNRLIVANRGNPDLHGRYVRQRERVLTAKPPEELKKWQFVANANLDNLIALDQFDPNTPKGSQLEIRNYYGRNILPESMKTKGGKPVNIDNEIDTMFDTLESNLDDLGEMNKPVAIREDWSKAPNYSKVAPVISRVASEMGVPEQLAINLIGQESTFNPSAEGPVIASGSHKGDRAMGLGQVMARTAAAYGVTDRSKLGTEEQVRLALRVLKDNFKKSGSWKDAVSMYFTGNDYRTALARNATDGFKGVLEYVEDIAG
jgi:hypothetical protein